MPNMVGKTCEAQELTIRLLMLGTPEERLELYRKAANKLNYSRKEKARKQLQLCWMMAGQMNDYQQTDYQQQKKGYQDPNYPFPDFISIAKAIVSRRKQPGQAAQEESTGVTPESNTVVRQKEISAVLGMDERNGNSRISDIRNGSPVKLSEIEALYAGPKNKEYPVFEEASSRFWKNMCYRTFPYLRMADTRNGPEMECLQLVWSVMDQKIRAQAIRRYVPFTHWFSDKLDKDSDAYDLYAVLEKAWQHANLTRDDVCDKFDINTIDTWYNYKRAFEEKETIYPKNWLSREQLLYLAVMGDLGVNETVKLMAEAGYSFYICPLDQEVMQYLKKRDMGEKISGTEKSRIANMLVPDEI